MSLRPHRIGTLTGSITITDNAPNSRQAVSLTGVGMQLLPDTSVLIDALRLRGGRRQWLAELVRAGHTLATSALNLAEVYAGVRPEEESRTKALLGAMECHEITAGVAEKAGKLKSQWSCKGRTLTLADA